jgi:hypothetical protein
LVLLD